MTTYKHLKIFVIFPGLGDRHEQIINLYRNTLETIHNVEFLLVDKNISHQSIIDKMNISDAAIIDTSAASVRVGFCIAYLQFVRQIPILCLWPNVEKTTAIIEENPGLEKATYDLHNFAKIIKDFITKVRIKHTV